MLKKEKFEIILEDIRKENKATQEGHDILYRKIDSTRSELKQDMKDLKFALGGRMGKVEEGIKDLKIDLGGKIDRVLAKVEDHETRITTIERRR
ncbi:MAG: hypothetical protein NT030_03960 [Candidatus Saganbacteria bacterium]|nr:hypothetical protein [Candidatus Saganbacteria bacterium]